MSDKAQRSADDKEEALAADKKLRRVLRKEKADAKRKKEETKQTEATETLGKRQRKATAAAAAAATVQTQDSVDEDGDYEEEFTSRGKKQAREDDRVWVQCNDCDKWRALPPSTDSSQLPDIWVCSLNTTDPDRNHCDAPEENFDEEDVELRSFLKVWAKRLRNVDRIESRLSSSAAATRGRKRKVDVDWIQCCNPACGKWRAMTRGLEPKTLLERLNRNKFSSDTLIAGATDRATEWFCSMNNWDEITASCAAPQESLWNCRWNLSEQ